MKGTGFWIHRNTDSAVAARGIEQHLIDLGFEGGAGGGDASTTYVYAYKKTLHTDENA
ncbi:MAG: hypothetical protein IH944_13120 [Armatimonadetes bacterium]|nr:hypothetical protein [Armatimonadota bacterium]